MELDPVQKKLFAFVESEYCYSPAKDRLDDFFSSNDPVHAAWMRSRWAHFLQNAYDQMDDMLKVCESPIEKLLVVAIDIIGVSRNVEEIVWVISEYRKCRQRQVCNQLMVEPQAMVGKYRIDFKFTWDCDESDWENRTTLSDGSSVPGFKTTHREVYVECDGHDFHERTKEQAKRDRKKDRDLQAAGFNILRFTGSEIWADPIKCAGEILDYLQRPNPPTAQEMPR